MISTNRLFALNDLGEYLVEFFTYFHEFSHGKFVNKLNSNYLIQTSGIGSRGFFGIPALAENFSKNTPPPGDFEKIRHFVPEIEENGKISLNLTRFSLN